MKIYRLNVKIRGTKRSISLDENITLYSLCDSIASIFDLLNITVFTFFLKIDPVKIRIPRYIKNKATIVLKMGMEI